MKRAAIYSRFSTDLQNDRSIEDQIALCREFAARHGLTVTATFEDRAVSGSNLINRLGVQRLLAAAKARQFDVLIAESMSRVGRDQEDRAAIRKRLRFAGIAIMTPADGVVTDLTDGIRAVIDSQYLDDLKHSIRRGMSGVVRSGRSGGGLAYGYRVVKNLDERGEPIRGLREIDEAQSAIVRRIFVEFLSGRSPRDIAHRLNAEGMAAPRGQAWNASTINGDGKRGNGILRNEIYVGRLIWNKVAMVKDPDTSRRISRPNARGDRVTTAVPGLAIVPLEQFEAVQAMRAGRTGVPPSAQRRPRYMLSGLLRCAACGAGMSTYGGKRQRVRCSAAAESGTCPDPKTFYRADIEAVVLAGLKAEMRQPEAMAAFVKEYHDERKRLASKGVAERARTERRLGEVRREIKRLVEAIAKGHGDPAVLGPRSSVLDAERKALEAKLTVETPKFITLHPAALARYEQQLIRLDAALSAGLDSDPEAVEAIRDLISTVTPRRGPNGLEVTIEGRLNALLGAGAKTVAGERYGHPAHPIMFRLRAYGT